MVVRLQERILVLGHTPTHISYLCELESFEGSETDGRPWTLPSDFQGLLTGGKKP